MSYKVNEIHITWLKFNLSTLIWSINFTSLITYRIELCSSGKLPCHKLWETLTGIAHILGGGFLWNAKDQMISYNYESKVLVRCHV